MTDLYFCHVTHSDRDTVPCRDGDVANLLDIRHPSEAVHQERPTTPSKIAAADIGVVGFESLGQLSERQVMFDQAIRVNLHLVDLLVAAPAVHFRHARNRPEGGLDGPIVERA